MSAAALLVSIHRYVPTAVTTGMVPSPSLVPPAENDSVPVLPVQDDCVSVLVEPPALPATVAVTPVPSSLSATVMVIATDYTCSLVSTNVNVPAKCFLASSLY